MSKGGSSPWQKSRASMRRGIGPGSRRRDDAVLIEIRASLDNEKPGPMTQAATARILPRAVKPSDQGGMILFHQQPADGVVASTASMAADLAARRESRRHPRCSPPDAPTRRLG